VQSVTVPGVRQARLKKLLKGAAYLHGCIE
jgi:hypothetical protein